MTRPRARPRSWSPSRWSTCRTRQLLLRGERLALRESDFVIAARSLRADGPRLLLHYCCRTRSPRSSSRRPSRSRPPSSTWPASASSGSGPPDPRTPEWGTMLTDSTLYLRTALLLLIFFPAPPSRSARSASTSSATGCASRSIRASSARDEAGAPLRSRPCGARFRTHDGTVHAVNGVSFDLEDGRDAGARRRVGLWQERDEPGHHAAAAPAGRPDRGRARSSSRASSSRWPARVGDAGPARPRGRDDLPGPDDQPQPGPDDRGADGRDDPAHRRVTPSDARERACELLRMVGISQPETRLGNFPHQFSGGMRQRVMIAMALALEPKLLIADEPTTALDVTIQAQVLDLLRNLTTERGTALILITHDLGVVAGMTKRINVMYAGFIVESATTAELFAAPSSPTRSASCIRSRASRATRTSRSSRSRACPPICEDPRLGVHLPRAVRGGSSGAGKRCPTGPPEPVSRIETTGTRATHRVACWNPPTADGGRRRPTDASRLRPGTAAGVAASQSSRGRARRRRGPRPVRLRSRPRHAIAPPTRDPPQSPTGMVHSDGRPTAQGHRGRERTHCPAARPVADGTPEAPPAPCSR